MTGAPHDLVDRQPLDLAHPSDLRPAPHLEHRLPPRRSHDRARLGVTPDTTDHPSDGERFQPAQAGDYSGGAHTGAGGHEGLVVTRSAPSPGTPESGPNCRRFAMEMNTRERTPAIMESW